MAKQKLILIHGMGSHTESSFKSAVIRALKTSFSFYPDLAGKIPEELFDITFIGYNDIFDTYRKRMAETHVPALERLKDITGLRYIHQGLIKEWSDIEREIDSDGFFETHWLDVGFYYFTPLGEAVRVRVAERILEEIKDQASDCHILAHSLGTSVAHDTLAKLYSEDFEFRSDKPPQKLSGRGHALGSLHMIANASYALKSFRHPGRSVVRPGEKGCCKYFTQFGHELDPVSSVRPFDPNDFWSGPETDGMWHSNVLSAEDITGSNPHDIEHYLINPRVHWYLFSQLLQRDMTEDEVVSSLKAYKDLTLPGRYEELNARLQHLRLSDGPKGLLEAAIKIKDTIIEFGESVQFEGENL